MGNKFLAVLLALVAFAGLASAAAPSAVTSVSGSYANACIEFEWTYTETDATDFDLNLFNLQTQSNVAEFNGWDENHPASVTEWSFCTVTGGDYVRLIVTPIDSNTDYDNYAVATDQNKWYGTDNNTLVTAVTAIAGGNYLIYTVFLTIATLAALIILAVVLVMILKKMSLDSITRGLR